MSSIRISLFIPALALTLAACGNHRGTAYKASSSQHTASADSGSAYQAGNPSHESVGRPDIVRPNERPGLGTTYGESRVSRVRHSPFVRDSNSPFAQTALHYNDVEGIRAAFAYHRASLGTARIGIDGRIAITIVDEHGRALPGGRAGGRMYVAGQDQQRYNIEIRNGSGYRVEVVASVDGLDVIDGKPGSLSKRGYILQPHGSVIIDGFRTSEDTVAAFRFGTVSESYAARTSGDRNVGVIGVAFFAERGAVWTDEEIRRRDSADPFPNRYARPPSY